MNIKRRLDELENNLQHQKESITINIVRGSKLHKVIENPGTTNQIARDPTAEEYEEFRVKNSKRNHV